MVLEKVIFDNTVFNYFLRIHSVDLEKIARSIIRDKVLIPSQIVVEMKQLAVHNPNFKVKINKWIDLSHRKNFYYYCDTFDSIVYDNLKKVLDEGEAGAIAQAEKTRVSWFISDDTKNLPFIEKNFGHIKQRSIFFLIALADVSGLLANYENILIDVLRIQNYSEFKPSTRKKLKALIRSEYISALQLKGLSNDKKLISSKTSIDTILKNHELYN